MEVDAWVTALREAMASVHSAADFDVVLSDAGAELDVMTDEWTLHVEVGSPPVVWLALDVDPETVEEARAARQAVMRTAVDQALARADEDLGGALADALADSHDVLSLDLLAALKTHSARATESPAV